MLFVNNPGSWAFVLPPFGHAEWHGCTPTDLVFPFFLFIVGTASVLSLGKRAAQGAARAELARHALRRGATIVLVGWALAAFPFTLQRLLHLRIPGVLPRIGLVYALGALLLLAAPARRKAGLPRSRHRASPRPPHGTPLPPRLRPDARGESPDGPRPRPPEGAPLEAGVGPGGNPLDPHRPRHDADGGAHGTPPHVEDAAEGAPRRARPRRCGRRRRRPRLAGARPSPQQGALDRLLRPLHVGRGLPLAARSPSWSSTSSA